MACSDLNLSLSHSQLLKDFISVFSYARGVCGLVHICELRSQERVLDILGLALQVFVRQSVWVLELSSDPMQEQQALGTLFPAFASRGVSSECLLS